MKAVKILVAGIVLGIVSIVFCRSLNVFIYGTGDDINSVAGGVAVSVLLGGLSMLKFLLFSSRYTSRLDRIRNDLDSIDISEAKERLAAYKKGEDIDDRLNRDRVRYSRLFHELYRLSEELPKWLVKRDLYFQEVEFFLDKIEPMEKIKNPNYATEAFDAFRKMYKKKLKEKGLEERRE